MDTCVLLHRVQTLQAGRLERSLFTAVDAADEDRYQLMTARDSRQSVMDGLRLY
ncbi:hypothetical protein [Desulfosarcina alkanivorans]|jgi:hypothetical protein|nr:hypothetical protein [Desulfosarcina alkanivorans]